MGMQSVQTTATKLRRRQALLSDEDVRRWYNNLKRASEITADVRLRRLGRYCEEIRMQPKELIEKDPQIVTDILDDTITRMEDRAMPRDTSTVL